jgi:hypothetical protein
LGVTSGIGHLLNEFPAKYRSSWSRGRQSVRQITQIIAEHHQDASFGMVGSCRGVIVMVHAISIETTPLAVYPDIPARNRRGH